MPTLSEAYNALRAILDGPPPTQTIDLAAAASRYASLAALGQAIARFGGPSSLTVTGASLTGGARQALLAGSARVPLAGAGSPSTPVSVALTLTEPQAGTVLFTLALTITASGWTFDTTFAERQLPPTLRADDSSPTVSYGASALAKLVVDAPTLTASSNPKVPLRMSGALLPSGDLRSYRDWVGPWPLQLDGTVVLPATTTSPLLLDLRAVSEQGTIGQRPAELQRPGFALLAAANPDPDALTPPAYSELQLVGTAVLGGDQPIRVGLSATLMVSRKTWRLMADFTDQDRQLRGGLAQLARLFGLDAGNLRTPPALGGFETFDLDDAEIWLESSDGGVPRRVSAIAATIRSDTVWEPPIPFLKVSRVGTRWALQHTVLGGVDRTVIAGSVFGSLEFENVGKDPGIVDLSGMLPSFVITGEQREGTEINLSSALKKMFGHDVPELPGDPSITDLLLSADPFGQLFYAGGTIEFNRPIRLPLTGLSLARLSLQVNATASSLRGGIEGRLRLGAASPLDPPVPLAVPEFLVRAETPKGPQAGWVFSGGLVRGVPLTLGALLRLTPLTVPDEFDEFDALAVSRLEASVETGEGGPWSFAGAIGVAFRPTILGTQVAIAAGMELELARTRGSANATGWVAGELTVNRLLIRMRRDLGVAEPTYALRVQFADLWLQAATAWVDGKTKDGKTAPRHQVIAVTLGGATLGEVLEELVGLVAPTLEFKLDAPWDVLNRIELSRFTLTVDPTDRTIELTYDLNQDLVVMFIGKIGAKATLGDSGQVELILTGRLLDQEYTKDKPLRWDVANDPPPALPGKGPKLVELRYLALGQRLRLPSQPETVAQAIELLRKDMTEPPAGTDPLAHSSLQFDAASGLLAALDLRVLETVQVALVFNDPRLYGLFVALDGEKAGALAGLRFEVLYKKLPSGVGMFRTELRVPDHFRRIEFGEVSIGLGTIVVEVYTNGNFLVDLGFPHNRDFTRSFDAMVFPFLGRGGVYFGVLNGETSRRVPAIGNGTFSPVLELGVGLAVGVGKEIEVGPLSGGAYVELEVVFEGVLAWFNPSGQGQATALYHRAQGIVAIHGKVYASVDFTVVQARVTLEAYAQASVVFEAHRATVFGLYAKFDAEAEIKVLWFTVPFSFSAELDLSFTVGSDEPTPWTVTAAQPPRLAAVRAPRRLLRVQRAQALPSTSAAGELTEDAPWTWAPDFAAFPAPRTVDISLLPAFTVQHPLVGWGSATPLQPHEPDWQVAFPLFARNGVSAAARTAREATAPAYNPAGPVAAASLVEALLRWAVSGLPSGVSQPGTVTAGQLTLLGEELAKPYVARTQFTRDHLATFFGTNLHLRISGPAGAPGPEADSEDEGAMVFPAPPWLTIGCYSGGTEQSADLFTLHPVGPAYSAGAAAYLAGFDPVPAESEPEPDDPKQYQSFAARVFCDWSLMVAREAVRQASAALAGATVAMGAGATLDDTAGTLPSDQVSYQVRPGDTLAGLAVELGAGTAELAALNPGLAERLARATPGEVLAVRVGVAGCTLAAENAALPLAANLTVTLTNVRVQVRSQDTLSDLARRLYGNDQPATLAALIAGATLAEISLADAAGLLRPGASFQVPPRQDPLSGSHATDLLAAVMYVRCFAPADVPDAEWYAQAIADADVNRGVLSTVGPGQPLPAGSPLAVPGAYLGPLTASYQIQPGDTLLRIGAALSLYHAPGGYPAQSWTDFLAAVRRLGGASLPAVTVTVLPGESLTSLAARLVLTGVTDGAGSLVTTGSLVNLLADLPVLDPLATIDVAELPVSSTDRTLAAIAQLAGLTIAQVAQQPGVTGLPGLFPAGTPLRVTHLPSQAIDQLVAAVCGDAALGEISGRSSRALLAGIRLPEPQAQPDGTVTATGPPTGAFQLAGQQFRAPARNTAGLTVTVGASPGAQQGWISFAQAPGGTAEDQLTFEYTSQELTGLYPAGAFARPPYAAPAAIPVVGQVPRTYGLEQRVALQVARPLPIPGADPARPAGTATLWRLPAGLLDKARAAADIKFDLLRAGPDGAPVSDHDVVTDATFATVVTLRIRRAPDAGHAYELLGASPEDALLLRRLAQSPATTQDTSIAVAMAPAPGAGPELTGLTVFDADPAATFVIRASMATDLPLAAPPAVVSASLLQRASFLHLMWEASLGGGGYHLGFATADGADLPAGAFDADGTGTLWLIVILPDAQWTVPEGRRLHPADNCALIAPGLDAPLHALYAEAHGMADQPCPYPAELVTQALVPAGSAGVTLALPRGDDATTRLFSLMVAMIDGDAAAAFTASQVGPAAPPLREDGQLLPRWVRERQLRAARLAAGGSPGDPPPAGYWRYDQVVPLYRYAVPSLLAEVPGLPRPADDPYRGFQSGAGQAEATFRLGLADVFGNVSQEPFTATAQVPAGYTDPVLGPAAWPATATAFSVEVDARRGMVSLVAVVTAQPSNAIPGPLDPPAVASEAAGRQAARFGHAVYQLSQPTEHGTLLTTLAAGSDGQPAALPLTEGLAPLWRFAAAAYVAADAAARLVQPPLTGLATLGAVRDHFGLPLTVLGTANAGTPVRAIAQAGQTVTVTSRLPVAEGDSATSFLGRVPGGWPKPSPVALLTNADNAALPLRPGTVLTVPSRSLPLGPDAPRLTLAGVAAAHQTTAAQLAIDIKDLAVLSTGFAFQAADQTVTIGEVVDAVSVTTLARVQAAFLALAVDVAVAELADAAADSAGLFAPGATLTQTHVVAVPPSAPTSPTTPASLAPPNTLATLAGPDLDAVAAAAVGQPDLWAAGTQVTLGQHSPVSADSPEPLGLFAERHGSTAALLFLENPGLRLASDAALILPGTCAVPASPARPLRSTHTIAAGDRLSVLAGLFGTTPGDIAAGNQHMPDLLVTGSFVTVRVNNQQAQTATVAGDTLATVTARLQGQVPDVHIDVNMVGNAIADDPAILSEGTLLVLPLPVLARQTPQEIAAAYRVDMIAFGQANAALSGVLAPGVTLTVPVTGAPAQVTAPADTLNAVLSRCAATGFEVDLAALLRANWDVALFQAGAGALLPPAPASVSAPLGPRGGPFRFPRPVFPVSVTLRLERDQNTLLIADDPAVRRADTTVPPATDAAGTLDGFVTGFEALLPGLRLGTARASGERADLWAVNFGADGIKSVAVAPGVTGADGTKQPRFLALRPLYRELQSRTGNQVLVPELNADGKITTATTPLEFQGADVEAWARQLLADVDLFLSAPYAAGMFGNAGLDRLLRAKWTLTRAVARGLAPVLAVADARQQQGTASAITALSRDLGASLAAAYDVAAIVQYDATADTAYGAHGTALRPARLSGGALPPTDSPPSTSEFALSTASTDLAAPASFVSFAMTVPAPSAQAVVQTGPLEYVYDSVEFDIDTTADAADGYETASWLHFLRPLSGTERPAAVTTDLGEAQVPVPLRAHPQVPVLVEQTAAPTYPGDQPTLTQAAQWTFGVTYSHEHAAQDQVLLEVRFNVRRDSLAPRAAEFDLAVALARYTALGDQLRQLMTVYLDLDDPHDGVRREVAGTVAALVHDVAEAWDAHWPAQAAAAAAGPQADALPGDTRRFLVTLVAPEGRFSELTLTVDAGEAPLGAAGWPHVYVRDATERFVPLLRSPVNERECRYTPAEPTPGPVLVPVGGPRVVRLEWPGLNVAVTGNALASVSARRNADLIRGTATNPAFVLGTAAVTAPDIATPLLAWTAELPLSGESLEVALRTALQELFGGASGPPVTLGLTYGHQLVAGHPGLKSYLPAALYPAQRLSLGLAAALGQEATDWQNANSPAAEGSEWVVSLTLSSWLEPATSHPLLVIDRLVRPT